MSGLAGGRGVVLKLQVATCREPRPAFITGMEQRGHPAVHGCTVVQDGGCLGGVHDISVTRVWPWCVCLQWGQALWSDGLRRAPRPPNPMPFPAPSGQWGGGRGWGAAVAGVRACSVAAPTAGTRGCPADECVYPGPGHAVGAPRVSGSKSRGPVGRPVVPGPGASTPQTPALPETPLIPALAPSQQWRLSARPGLTSLTSCFRRSGRPTRHPQGSPPVPGPSPRCVRPLQSL